MTGKPYPPLAATPASRRPPRGNLVIWASQRPVPPLQRPLPHPHTHSLLTRANRFGRKRSRLYSSFDPGGETEAMVALHFSLSTLPSPSPARPAPRALGRVVPASLQPSGWRRGAEPGWSVGASASLSSSSSGSIGDRASRTPSVRSSLEIAGPTVGTVTEVDKDTFWPLVEAAGGKVVVLDMYTQWCGPCKIMAPKFQDLSEKYVDVLFLKLDCNQENRPLAKELGIKVVPTFKILKDGKVVKEVTGSKFDELVHAIDTVKSS